MHLRLSHVNSIKPNLERKGCRRLHIQFSETYIRQQPLAVSRLDLIAVVCAVDTSSRMRDRPGGVAAGAAYQT